MSEVDELKFPADVRRLAEQHPEYVRSLAENRSWNFINNLLDIGTYSVATAAMSETTIAPYFVSKMTSNPLVIGLIPALGWVGLYLPQILGAYLVHNTPQRKPTIVLLAWTERAIIFFIFLTTLTVGVFAPGLTLGLFLIAYSLLWITTGFLIPAYSDFYAKHIPTGRGTFYGIQTLVSGGMGFVGAQIIRWRLGVSGFPGDFQSVMAIALLAAIPGMLAIHNMREVPFPGEIQREDLGEYLREIPDLLRANMPFVRFTAVFAIIALGKMTIPFTALYAVQKFAIDEGYVAIFTGILLAAQSLSAPVWGYLGDQIGYRSIWLTYALLVFGQVLLAWLSPSVAWFFLIFALVGAILGVEGTARPNTVYELSPAAQTSRFVGLMNTLVAPWLAIGPLVAGALIRKYSYPAALAVGTMVAAGGVVATAIWLLRSKSSLPAPEAIDLGKRRGERRPG